MAEKMKPKSPSELAVEELPGILSNAMKGNDEKAKKGFSMVLQNLDVEHSPSTKDRIWRQTYRNSFIEMWKKNYEGEDKQFKKVEALAHIQYYSHELGDTITKLVGSKPAEVIKNVPVAEVIKSTGVATPAIQVQKRSTFVNSQSNRSARVEQEMNKSRDKLKLFEEAAIGVTGTGAVTGAVLFARKMNMTQKEEFMSKLAEMAKGKTFTVTTEQMKSLERVGEKWFDEILSKRTGDTYKYLSNLVEKARNAGIFSAKGAQEVEETENFWEQTLKMVEQVKGNAKSYLLIAAATMETAAPGSVAWLSTTSATVANTALDVTPGVAAGSAVLYLAYLYLETKAEVSEKEGKASLDQGNMLTKHDRELREKMKRPAETTK